MQKRGKSYGPHFRHSTEDFLKFSSETDGQAGHLFSSEVQGLGQTNGLPPIPLEETSMKLARILAFGSLLALDVVRRLGTR